MAEPQWTGPTLLVPITIEAMVFTGAMLNQLWSWERPNYKGLKYFLPVGGVPFKSERPSFPGHLPGTFTGAALNWALPSGITSGTQSGSGTVRYPAIPNRWLVVRKAVDCDNRATFAYRAWIIASDYVGSRGSSFPNATGDGEIIIGHVWSLDDWPGEAALLGQTLKRPLTATGPGDAAFGAFIPNIENVLSFADPLDDVAPGPVSYVVQGWYSSRADDPLEGVSDYDTNGWRTEAQWRALVEALGWSVGEEQQLADAVEAGLTWAVDHGFAVDPAIPRQRYPSRTLCHGLLYELAWPGPNGHAVSAVPTANQLSAAYVRPTVAIGNSTADALVALIGQRGREDGMPPLEVSQLENILAALQYDCLPLLDRPDGQAQLDLRIQSGWFGAVEGGVTWNVVAPERPGDPQGRTELPPLTPEQEQKLDELIATQTQLDESGRLLVSLQLERYSLWWKLGRARAMLPPPEQWLELIEAAIPPTDRALQAEIDRWQALRNRRNQAFLALRAILHDARLVSNPRAPFWQSNEPVVLVTGALRSYKHGVDGRFSDDDTLFCRFIGQTIDGISVDVNGVKVIVNTSQVPLPPLTHPDLPPGVRDVVAEAFFLDLSDAPYIASLADPNDPWALLAQIRQEQTLIWNPDLYAPIDRHTIAELSGLQTLYGLGALPSKLAIAPWTPPWTPLFLDWEVDFYPASLSPHEALRLWDFPAAASHDPRDEFVYAWNGPVPPITEQATRLRGRALLTPQATSVLPARIEQTIQRYGNDPSTIRDRWALLEALRYLENADLLSQSLSGFNLELLQRDPQTFRTPDETLDRYLRPIVAPAFTPFATPDATAEVIQFNPIRGGHFAVQRLHVVDGFGQVFDVLQALGDDAKSFRPTLGTDLRTPGSEHLVQLKPRVTQPSRLEFTLLSAVDDSSAGGHNNVNPVCGWLIPNRLDQSLAIYESDGTPRGELLLADREALWLGPPDHTPPPHGVPPPVNIQNRHLRAMVLGILQAENSALALQGMLSLLDEAAWAISTDQWADGSLPLLIGHPIAMLRARLSFCLEGLPATSQRWLDTGEHKTGGFENVPFPIQLGSTELLDDGLVGFYLDDDYGGIDSAYRLPQPNPYVGATRPSLAMNGASALLTMLAAPAGKITAFTGIAPPTVVELPSQFVTPALARVQITFRGGPVVNDAAGAVMPLPNVDRGAWSWLQYEDPSKPAAERGVTSADAVAQLPDAPPLLSEGWLKLVLGGAPARLTYAVSPSSVAVTWPTHGPSTVILQFTAYNGSGADVACSEIRIIVPIGAGEHELTELPDLIDPALPVDVLWFIESDGRGHVIARPIPPEMGLKRGETLRLTLAGVRVNSTLGSAPITVRETSSEVRNTSLIVTKVTP